MYNIHHNRCLALTGTAVQNEAGGTLVIMPEDQCGGTENNEKI